jgi:hypothetical protein
MYIIELLTETVDKCDVDNENVRPFPSHGIYNISGTFRAGSLIGLKIKSRLHV